MDRPVEVVRERRFMIAFPGAHADDGVSGHPLDVAIRSHHARIAAAGVAKVAKSLIGYGEPPRDGGGHRIDPRSALESIKDVLEDLAPLD